jgi:protein O-mannosyl-transferase
MREAPRSFSGVNSPSKRSIRSDAAPLALLLLLAVLPYANTLANSFVYDDYPQLVENPYVRSFRYLREVFGTTVWSFQGAQGITNYYRPLMTFGYLLCYQTFGPLPFGFHLANILVHAAVVCLLFGVTRRLFGDSFLAWLAAALFALHPIHTESVAWVAGIPDIELTFFYLLTFWFFLRTAESSGRRALVMRGAMAGSFVLALLSKEPALTLAPVATLYEHIYRDDRAQTSTRVKLSRYGALWVLGGAYLLFRARFLGGLAPVLQRPRLGWFDAGLSALALIAQYVWKLLWPVRLCAFHIFHPSSSPLDLRVLAGVAALLACATVFALVFRRARPIRARPISFALLWLLLTLAPVLNARWMANNVFAERYLYLPSVGFCWVVAWGAVEAWRASRAAAWRRGLGFALCGVAALYAARTITRNRDWHDEWTFCTRTLECSPEAYLIRTNLGKVYWDRGDVRGAEREWLEAYRLSPTTVVTLNNLGLLYTRLKRYPEAVEFLKKAIALKPAFAAAHLSLAMAYGEMGLPSQADSEYRTAVRLAPLYAEARRRLGEFLFDAGRLVEAEEQLRRAAEIEPRAESYSRLGEIYLRWESSARAEQAFARALSLDPFDSRAHFRLGALYMARGRAADAAREYEAGLQTNPGNAEAQTALRELKAQAPSAAPPRP